MRVWCTLWVVDNVCASLAALAAVAADVTPQRSWPPSFSHWGAEEVCLVKSFGGHGAGSGKPTAGRRAVAPPKPVE